MRTELFAEFRKFVMEQPDDRPIQQEGYWCGCAVGDFQREKKEGHSSDFLAAKMQYTSRVREKEHDAPYWVLEILNRSGKITRAERYDGLEYASYFKHLRTHKVPPDIDTYGKLKHLIQVTEEYFT